MTAVVLRRGTQFKSTAYSIQLVEHIVGPSPCESQSVGGSSGGGEAVRPSPARRLSHVPPALSPAGLYEFGYVSERVLNDQ